MSANPIDNAERSAKGHKIFRSACKMCHGGCGALIHVKDGKVVKIKGDPESPLNKGKMCPKGLASIEHLYHPDRLKYPLKRVGKRGEGKWERISWDEALDRIADKILEIKKKHGIESVAVGMGTGRYHFLHVVRFVNRIGTPNWCEPGTAQCFIPRVLTSLITYGDITWCDYYGDVNPECVLVWGQNPVISGPDGETQFMVRECLRKGTKLIVVDPRRTELAKKAEIWLQVRPGTDDALALGMMNVMINEGIYDKEFVEEWTVGFDKLKERVSEYPPEKVAEITWVSAEKIKSAARFFAKTKPATLEWGVALEQTPNSLQTVRAVSLIPAITGNIDIPGGWIFGMHIANDPYLYEENVSPELNDKRLGADRFKALCSRDALLKAAHNPTIFKAMKTGNPYPIKAFLIFGNNGLVSYGNSRQVYESLNSLDFLSVMDIYMTPTAQLADIVLPAATWLEADEIVGIPLFSNNVVLAMQKVVQMHECRQPEEVFVDLERRLSPDGNIESVEEIYDKQLEPLGISFQELKEKGFVTAPMQYKKYESEGFRTRSGKIELASSYLEMLGYDPLPYYQEPPESPISAPEVACEYPLILITGGRSRYFFCSEYRQIPSLRKRHKDPIVEIHPDTAKEHGIRDGDWIWIESPRGRIQQKARITDGIDPRVVNVQYGWWFPEDPAPEYGVWRSNANVLTSNEPPYDPAMGTYQLRALLCKIYKEDD
jgi:thiosulfate reductase/polysulfide reductase chain A